MTSVKHKYLVVVVGPTAIGKTALSIRLAQHYGAEIISADSRQFYKELKIGVAAPSDAELAAATHHFIGHLSIHDYYNASRFEKDALQKIEALFETHNIVVMTGGSGLYIDAVCNGIDDLPDPTPELRTELKTLFQKEGIESLQNLLQTHDPEYYNAVDTKNPARLLRALEVCITAGQPYSSLRTQKLEQRPFEVIFIGLHCERALLNERIHRRVDEMLTSGLLDEVERLFPMRHLNALNTVGYKELFAWKEGKISFEQAIEDIKTNTRRYAKRQMTWFRKNPNIRWFLPEQFDEICDYSHAGLSRIG
jgi:tRNA dimethylallyltransferase